MKEIFDWFSSRDNITFAIAVAGFLLSTWNTVHDWIRNRRAVTVEIKDIFSLRDTAGRTTEIIKLIIVNRSKEPITISKLTVHCGESVNQFGEYRPTLLTTRNKDSEGIIEKTTWHPAIFPVKIEGLGGERFLFASTGDLAAVSLNRWCIAEFSSNKGRFKKKFQVSHFADKSLLEQCQFPD